MSHPKHKKQAEKSDRSEFFAARASTPKATGLLDQAQDGDGGNDTLPLRTPTGSHNLPVTQDFLQTCLEDMSSKILASIQSTLRELSKEVQELGDRTARVEQLDNPQTCILFMLPKSIPKHIRTILYHTLISANQTISRLWKKTTTPTIQDVIKQVEQNWEYELMTAAQFGKRTHILEAHKTWKASITSEVIKRSVRVSDWGHLMDICGVPGCKPSIPGLEEVLPNLRCLKGDCDKEDLLKIKYISVVSRRPKAELMMNKNNVIKVMS
ncbi:Hypothetical predicted protein [Pelobates cultripes]|uniref:Uncharacterized protein n=1 Tax=Pelobates cultripes TaxID=61616 RepID=A0AAD1T6F4_PELCU|nr:Hypothetical predicted protein [Pelobates cultripes]